MRRISALFLAVVCTCGLLAAQDNAQTGADAGKTAKHAKYAYWEEVKVNNGKWTVFSKNAAEFRDAANSSSSGAYWIAGNPITGDDGRVTYVTFQDSMAGVEKFIGDINKVFEAAAAKNPNMEAESGESEGPARTGLARYRDDLSYRPDMVSPGDMRWWNSEVIGLHAGCEKEFEDAVKQIIDLHKKVQDNDHWSAYEMVAGEQLPAMLFVTSMKSLADDDVEPPAAAKELFDSPLVRRLFENVGKNCITGVWAQYSQVQPGLSRPWPNLAASNPDFWNAKPPSMSNTPAKKGKKTGKKTTTQP